MAYPDFDLVKLYHPGGIVDHIWGNECPCRETSIRTLQREFDRLQSDNEDLEIELAEMRAHVRGLEAQLEREADNECPSNKQLPLR